MKVKIIVVILFATHMVQGSDKGNSAVGIYTNCGPRPRQEDRYICQTTNDTLVLGVFDGHSGHQVADFVAKNIVTFYEKSAGEFPEKVTAAFQCLDNTQHIKQYLKCGSTASVVFIDKNVQEISFANLGNSRALLEKTGAIDFVTKDHTLARDDERSRVQSLGADVGQPEDVVRRIEGWVCLSRFFGGWWMKQYISADPECATLQLTPENRYVILATDGLWCVMSNEQVLAKMREYIKAQHNTPSADSIAQLLGQAAIEKSKDNITILVVDLLLLACGNNQENTKPFRTDRACDFFSFLLY